MSDLLKQILAKIPAQTSSVNQLQQIFKALNNTNLQGFIDYKPNTNQQQLTLTLPLISRSNVATALNIDLSLVKPGLSNAKLNQPLMVEVVPSTQGNRVSFELTVRQTDLLKTIPPELLKSFTEALSSWSKNATPLVFIKEIPLNAASTNQNLAVSSAVQQLVRNSLLDLPKTAANTPSATDQSLINKIPNRQTVPSSTNAISSGTANQANKSDPSNYVKPMVLNITLSDSLKKSVMSEQKSPIFLSDQQSAQKPSSANTPNVFFNSKLTSQQVEVIRNTVSNLNPQPPKTAAPQVTALTSLIELFPLLNKVGDQLSGASENSGASKNNISRLIQTALQSIPDASELTKDTLKRALNNSGIFYENKQSQALGNSKLNFELLTKAYREAITQLANDKSTQNLQPNVVNAANIATNPSVVNGPLQGDLKHLFNVLRFLLAPLTQDGASANSASKFQAAATNSPSLPTLLQRIFSPNSRRNERAIDLTKQQLRVVSQLAKDIDSASSNIRTTQASNLLNNDPTSLFIEIPLFYKQQLSTVQLNFEYERNRKPKQQHQWNVTVRFDFPRLGAFHAIVKLQNDYLDVRFVAEKSATQALLADSMKELETRLRQSGLNVTALDSETGTSAPLSASHSQASGVNFVI